MIDFLIISGIKKETIDEINKNTSHAFNLNCNKDECVEIIKFLKLIGINNIDDLLLYKTKLFYKTKEEISYLFSKHNTSQLVDQINEDFENIELLFN